MVQSQLVDNGVKWQNFDRWAGIMNRRGWSINWFGWQVLCQQKWSCKKKQQFSFAKIKQKLAQTIALMWHSSDCFFMITNNDTFTCLRRVSKYLMKPGFADKLAKKPASWSSDRGLWCRWASCSWRSEKKQKRSEKRFIWQTSHRCCYSITARDRPHLHEGALIKGEEMGCYWSRWNQRCIWCRQRLTAEKKSPKLGSSLATDKVESSSFTDGKIDL